MDQFNSKQSQNRENLINNAIKDIQSGVYRGSKSAARAYNLPPSTVRSRMAGRKIYVFACKSQQILSNAEEKTLV